MSGMQFEEAKKEIRSVLITFQKGCSLSEFKKEYRSIIGRPLPSKEFNFKDDISFLRSMPDAVAVYNSPVPGDFLLIGIADQSVKHIQKMVCRQKPSKHKPSFRAPRRSFSRPVFRSYESSHVEPARYNDMPPRFRKQVVKEKTLLKKELPAGVSEHVIHLFEQYQEGLKLGNFLETFRNMYKREFTFKDWGFSTLEECLETIPGLQAFTRNNEIIVYLETNDLQEDQVSRSVDNHVQSPATQMYADGNSSQNLPPRSNTNSASENNFLLNRFVNDVQQKSSDFQTATTHPFDVQYSTTDSNTAVTSSEKNTASSNVQHSKGDTLDNFQLIDFRDSQTNSSNTSPLQYSENFESKKADKLDSFLLSSHDLPTNIPGNVINNLLEVLKNYPQGIFASEFPSSYEKVTHTKFDLHCLGFNHLADFIDAVPDIFVRRPLTGSKKDWLIYPSKFVENTSVADISEKGITLFTECIILNTRKILQGYAEGISLSEFNHIYSINCNEPLYIRDLGYVDIETFLLSIAHRVPLSITGSGNNKIVHLEKFEEAIKPPVPPQPKMAPLDAKFKDLQLPVDYVNTQYIPMYTSSIANPGFFYIQLQGDEYSEALKSLYDDIEDFYNGEFGNGYTMDPKDIRVGAACIALWPSDKHWYRAKISSIVSMQVVMVFYVDYGTTDEIPLSMLRYIKNEYLVLPAQALKSRLKYVKPAHKATVWDKRSRQRMLELCQDISLMGKIEDINDGVLSLILCDTNGAEDLYINDILAQEGIAEYFDELEKPKQPSTTEIAQQQLLQLLAAISSAAGLPTSPNGADNITKMVQNCSLNPAFNPGVPSVPSQNPLISLSPVPPILPPCIAPPMNTGYPYSNSLNNAFGRQGMNAEVETLGNALTGANFNVPQTTQLPGVSPPSTPSPDAGDVFDEDDDASFEQFYKTLSAEKANVKKRYVKRIKTGDGYVFHVLLYNSRPFVSSGDISVLIWNTKEPSYLFNRLQSHSAELPSVTLQEEGHEEFFEQIRRFRVKGIVQNDNNKSSILMYSLEYVNRILNHFGHPSASLRAKIVHESTSFNPLAPHWQESPDSDVPEEIEEVRSVTDDDKLNRLCLFDLNAMKAGIRVKRLKLTEKTGDLSNKSNLDAIVKLDQLFCKVRDRIQEIELICSTYS